MTQAQVLRVGLIILWVLPIVLGILIAKRRGRSPHWMWFGIHPLGGWIACLVLYFDTTPLKERRAITAFCSDEGAVLKVSFDASQITTEMKTSLEKRLLKKNAAIVWSDQEATSEVIVRIIAMDQGNQLLRYLLPFIAPSVVEVEGQVALRASPSDHFHYTRREQLGVLGGSARSMLKVAARGVAKKIASQILRSARAQEKMAA